MNVAQASERVILRLRFYDHLVVQQWLESGARLPAGLGTRYFGSVMRPPAKPAYEIGSRARYAEFLRKAEGTGRLFGEEFYISFSLVGPRPAEVDLTEESDHEGCLVGAAAEVLGFFGTIGATYGFACQWGELHQRNLFGYIVAGTHRPSTGMVGQDIRRYVPGLYWLNYFSSPYLQERQFDVDQFVSRAGCGKIMSCASGVILRLYDHPAEWVAHREAVDAAIAGTEQVFSMSRIHAPPGMTRKEYSEFSLELSKRFP